MFQSPSDLKKIVAIAIIPFILPGCHARRDDSGHWDLEREQIELTQKLKLAEYRLGLMPEGDMTELNRLQSLVTESDAKLHDLRSQCAALGAEVGEMELRNDELCQSLVENQRKKALGLKFDSLSVKDGRTFNKVSIAGVEDGGVAIRHEHGAARLRYAELTSAQCLLFGLEEESALAAEDQERREALAYERSVELEMEVVREKEERDAIAATARKDEEARISRSLLAAAATNHEPGPLGQPARQVGSGSSYRRWYGYSNGRSYQPTYRYVYYYPAVRNPYCSPRTYRSVGDNRIVVPRVPNQITTP